MRSLAALVAVTGCLLALPAPHLAGQGFALTAMELLDQYEHDPSFGSTGFKGVIHVESVKDDLHAQGERWIEEAGPKNLARRRLIAATFALETARAGLDYEWANSVELIDWGWAQLSKQRPPLPAERLWHLAAIALFQGAYDQRQLEPRLRRIKNRFPSEPRILLTNAWMLESLRGGGFPPPSRGKPGGTGDTGSNIRAAYVKALASSDVAVAGEADLRLGYYDLIADRSESALTRLAHAAAATTDPDVLYLAHLFRGWTLTRMNRETESTAEYQRAVDTVPAGSTGSLWLARRLLLEGKRNEADAVADRSLVGSRDIEDPWRLYGYGDFRRFPAFMKQLREAIR